MCTCVWFCYAKVKDLESPLGVLPMAVLRSPDIISFTVHLPKEVPAHNTAISPQ